MTIAYPKSSSVSGAFSTGLISQGLSFCTAENKKYKLLGASSAVSTASVVWPESFVSEYYPGYIPQIPDCFVKNAEVLKQRVCQELIETASALLKEVFTTINKIDIETISDPEILGRNKVRFTLHVTGNPEHILTEEDRFYKLIRTTMTSEEREMISLTYDWA